MRTRCRISSASPAVVTKSLSDPWIATTHRSVKKWIKPCKQYRSRTRTWMRGGTQPRLGEGGHRRHGENRARNNSRSKSALGNPSAITLSRYLYSVLPNKKCGEKRKTTPQKCCSHIATDGDADPVPSAGNDKGRGPGPQGRGRGALLPSRLRRGTGAGRTGPRESRRGTGGRPSSPSRAKGARGTAGGVSATGCQFEHCLGREEI